MKTRSLLGLAFLLLVGCAGTATKPEEVVAGPHGGTYVEAGDEDFVLEVTVDKGKQEMRVYVLTSEDQTAAPVTADKLALTLKMPELTIDLTPEKQAGDPEGKASVFVAKNAAFAKDQAFGGTIKGTINDNSYEGTFELGGADSKGKPTKSKPKKQGKGGEKEKPKVKASTKDKKDKK